MDNPATKYLKGWHFKGKDRAEAVFVALYEHMGFCRANADTYGSDADDYHAGWRDALLAVSETATILQEAKDESV